VREKSTLAGLFLLALAAACGGRANGHRTIYSNPGPSQGEGGATSDGGAADEGGAAGAEAGRSAGGAGATARGGAGGSRAGHSGAGGRAGAAGLGGKAGARSCERRTGDLEIISVTADCRAADGDADSPQLTPDARYVAFDSDAGDLVAHDENGASDVFLYDRDTQELELISKATGSDAAAHGYGFTPVPSDDAQTILFTGLAYDLTPSAPPDGIWAYVRDRRAGTTVRLSGDYACAYALGLSGDAHYAVVEGYTNCQGDQKPADYWSAFEYDLESGKERALGTTGMGDNYDPVISRNGRYVLWATRPPMTLGQNSSQIVLWDRQAQAARTLPLLSYNYSSLDISEDGAFIAFSSMGQVYRYEVATDSLVLVSHTAAGKPGDDASLDASMSADGRFIAFKTSATDLVENDTNGALDVVLYDAQADSIARLSVAADGSEADADSDYPSIAKSGVAVVFVSKARNLSPLSTQGNYQVYVWTNARVPSPP
jgi:Tol biopolymer transport system component